MTRLRDQLALILLLACQRAPRPPAGGGGTAVHEVPPESARVTPAPLDSTAALQQARDSAIAAYVAAREQFGTTQGRIREALGTPDSIQATPFQNAHDSTQTDTVIRLYYPGVMLGLYRVALSGTDLLGEVILSRQRGAPPLGVGIGSTREQLEAALGPPNEEGQDEAGHQTVEYVRELAGVTFVLDKGVVSRIEWAAHVD